jgi:hypothetical protein
LPSPQLYEQENGLGTAETTETTGVTQGLRISEVSAVSVVPFFFVFYLCLMPYPDFLSQER